MQEVCIVFILIITLNELFPAGALIFGCTVALCFLIRDLMFYVIGESCCNCLAWGWAHITHPISATLCLSLTFSARIL